MIAPYEPKSTTPLYDKAGADKLFRENAIFDGAREAVPEFRLVELFGIRAMHWIDRMTGHTSGISECIGVRYLTHAAFQTFIGIINLETVKALYFLCDAKLLMDEARAQQEAEREAARAEEERQKQERKAAAKARREAKEARK